MFQRNNHRASGERRMLALDLVALEAEVTYDLHIAFCHGQCTDGGNAQLLFVKAFLSAVRLSQAEGVPLTPYLSLKYMELEGSL